ncbi:hypothetical protein F7725_028100 [Dissostichus mawsoni]|uniref:Uncharacterized protein n=1 Tax=Dissostichus mawsoni TaxID=36200 RepID=A0A7J5XET2_DISMA|nr:hypothetical protein F7725_028100 [Dissostichus mawsoni]
MFIANKPGSTSRQCSSCCMSVNVACKTCKFCKALQPRKLRLSKRMDKFDTKANTWLEVGGKLYTLKRDDLIEVCDFLTIAGTTFEYVSGKSRSSLISHVTMHLEREELSELEDQGTAELLVLKDKIVELQQAALLREENREKEQGSGDKQTDVVQEHVIQPSERESLLKEIEKLQSALAFSLQAKSDQISGTQRLVSGEAGKMSGPWSQRRLVPSPAWNKEGMDLRSNDAKVQCQQRCLHLPPKDGVIEPAAASETPQPPAENSPATSKVVIATAHTPTESSGNLSEEMYTLTLIPVPAASTYSPPSPSAASQPGKRKKGLPTERSSSPRLATSVANGCSSTTGEGMKKRNKENAQGSRYSTTTNKRQKGREVGEPGKTPGSLPANSVSLGGGERHCAPASFPQGGGGVGERGAVPQRPFLKEGVGWGERRCAPASFPQGGGRVGERGAVPQRPFLKEGVGWGREALCPSVLSSRVFLTVITDVTVLVMVLHGVIRPLRGIWSDCQAVGRRKMLDASKTFFLAKMDTDSEERNIMHTITDQDMHQQSSLHLFFWISPSGGCPGIQALRRCPSFLGLTLQHFDYLL